MLSKYKKSFEKQVMGYLSYLPDFKNFQNLADEMRLYNSDNNQFDVLTYTNEMGNCLGIVGIQLTSHFVIIRYLSLAPSYRTAEVAQDIIKELDKLYPEKKLTTFPNWTNLLKYTK
ncbi:reductase [Lactobacillus sp. PV034]|uniref:reductase n=1 Tax=Lactobacillus sp. PV034 TaxID=2594495 RepID=UPI00223F7336|nr:reductase [Lactobacillus sp. PV034]QNQ80490.1 reductase [Lactobacillus sp. PV034]